MKRGCPPLWLLRDAPALAAVFATLWAMIFRIWIAVWRAERRKRPPTAAEQASIFQLLAAAESALDFAIARQAHRLLGLGARGLKPLIFDPPTTRDDFNRRYAGYLHAYEHIDAAARHTAEQLRLQYRISRAEAEAVRAAHGSANVTRRRLAAPGRRATRRDSVRASCPHDGLPRRRAPKAGDGLAFARARAPPQLPRLPTAYSRLPRWLRQRERSRAPTAPPISA